MNDIAAAIGWGFGAFTMGAVALVGAFALIESISKMIQRYRGRR